MNCIDMINWMIYSVVTDKIENEFLIPANAIYSGRRDGKAIRFDFRYKAGGAISLLFHSSSPNWHYISVYSIDSPVVRASGVFPKPGNPNHWKFRTDHDCATRDAISNFLREHQDVIESWDFIYPWKVIDISDEEIKNMKKLKDIARDNR